MSRTYRKNSIIENQTMVEFINTRIAYAFQRSYYYEFYITVENQKAYDNAICDWELKYQSWLNLSHDCLEAMPRQPSLYNYKSRRKIYKSIDINNEINKAKQQYINSTRDGRFNDSRNQSFKKHCASSLRMLNRKLARNIIKNDDTWENLPYPDTYLGKKMIWHYW